MLTVSAAAEGQQFSSSAPQLPCTSPVCSHAASLSSSYWSEDEADQDSDREDAALTFEVHSICAAVAAAVVAHGRLPARAVGGFHQHLPTVSACSLAILSEDGRSLRQLPLMDRGSMNAQALEPGEAVGRETAAWQAFQHKRVLVWSRSRGEIMFADWRAALKACHGAGAVTVPLTYSSGTMALGSATFVLDTEPSTQDLELLELYGREVGQHINHSNKHLWEVSLGFLNQVLPQKVTSSMLRAAVASSDPRQRLPRLGAVPVQQEQQAQHAQQAVGPGTGNAPQSPGRELRPATPGVARDGSAQHVAWECAIEAAGAAAGAGPGGGESGVPLGTPAVGTAAVETAAAAGGELAASAASGSCTPLQGLRRVRIQLADDPPEGGHIIGGKDGGEKESQTITPTLQKAASGAVTAVCGSPPNDSKTPPTPVSPYGMYGASHPGYPPSDWISDSRPASPLRFFIPDIPLDGVPMQKWTLEFADPRLEELYKSWFNGRQAIRDQLVFVSYAAMLLLALLGLLLRGSLNLPTLLVCAQVLASTLVPVYLVRTHLAWYVRTRSLIVASMRMATCVTILGHSYCHPELYGDSLLKALCGNCALSIAFNTFRNKLRFTNHLSSQLFKLYLCATYNAFVYSDSTRASRQFLTLGQSAAAQLLAVVLPSVGLYRMEARTRRVFVQRQGNMAN